MRQHLSVFWFFIRNSFHKVLLALILMAAAEGGLFYFVWKQLEKQYLVGKIRVVTLELIADKAQLDLVFLVAVMILVGVLQFSNGATKGGRPEYTLYRLSISPRYTFLWQAVYHCCCFLLFWAMQAAVAVGLGFWFVKVADPAMVTNQSLFLAFQRNEFFHSVIPLQDTMVWATNIMCLFILSILTAYQISRFGKKSGKVPFAYYWAFYVMLWLRTELLGFVLMMIVLIITLLVIGYQVFCKGEWNLDV